MILPFFLPFLQCWICKRVSRGWFHVILNWHFTLVFINGQSGGVRDRQIDRQADKQRHGKKTRLTDWRDKRIHRQQTDFFSDWQKKKRQTASQVKWVLHEHLRIDSNYCDEFLLTCQYLLCLLAWLIAFPPLSKKTLHKITSLLFFSFSFSYLALYHSFFFYTVFFFSFILSFFPFFLLFLSYLLFYLIFRFLLCLFHFLFSSLTLTVFLLFFHKFFSSFSFSSVISTFFFLFIPKISNIFFNKTFLFFPDDRKKCNRFFSRFLRLPST